MHDPLSRFENHIQRLVEGGFARLFAGRLHPREVAVQLARAMEDRIVKRGGESFAPDIYVVRLNAIDFEAILDEQSDLSTTLAAELLEMARAADLKINHYPQVKLLADGDVLPRQVVVGAMHSNEQALSTQGMPLASIKQALDLPQAYLVLNGDQHIPLTQPIINIGRNRDNHIILDDPRVSRHHAQIRLRFGRYMLFDLGSSLGILVNDQKRQEATLFSGDIIVMGSSRLVYLEEREDNDDEDTDGYTKGFTSLKD